jgi:hypothetical protein
MALGLLRLYRGARRNRIPKIDLLRGSGSVNTGKNIIDS